MLGLPGTRRTSSPRQRTVETPQTVNDTLGRPRGRRGVSSKGRPCRCPEPAGGPGSLPRSDLVHRVHIAPAETPRCPRGLQRVSWTGWGVSTGTLVRDGSRAPLLQRDASFLG